MGHEAVWLETRTPSSPATCTCHCKWLLGSSSRRYHVARPLPSVSYRRFAQQAAPSGPGNRRVGMMRHAWHLHGEIQWKESIPSAISCIVIHHHHRHHHPHRPSQRYQCWNLVGANTPHTGVGTWRRKEGNLEFLRLFFPEWMPPSVYSLSSGNRRLD